MVSPASISFEYLVACLASLRTLRLFAYAAALVFIPGTVADVDQASHILENERIRIEVEPKNRAISQSVINKETSIL